MTTGRLTAKLALPEASVLSVVAPMSVCPSPWPEGSGIAWLKNWTVNVVLGVLLSVPWTKVALPLGATLVRIGKFWRLLGPACGPPGELAVTPKASWTPPTRLIPSWLFDEMLL